MRSIRGKLWLGMMALVGVVLLLLWLLQVVFLESFYADMRVADIRRSLDSVIYSMREDNRQAVIYELDRLASTQNLTIEWLDADGRAIHLSYSDASGQMPMMRNMIRTELYRTVLAGEGVQASLAHPRFGSEYKLLGMPVFTSADELTGALMVTVPMAAVEETAVILKRQLIYVSILLLAVASLCSFWLARGFTRPIVQIRRVSAAMAAGDFSARTDYRSQDEIGALAASVDHLGDQLSKIEQLRRDLVANVSHELRTPLSVIRGYAETIRDISGDQPEQREAQLAIIVEETERLTNLVNDNLHLALLRSGNADLNLRAFQLCELLQDTIEHYQLIADQKGVKLAVQGNSEIGVFADEAKIEQVVRNLIQNGLQHTVAGGEVVVRVTEDAQTVRVVVADTGSGIPAEDLPHIWDKFYQVDANDAKSTQGAGLGLAIVKGILEAHQAEYGVESQPGRGTAVWFELRRKIF